jgi:hypothetical protein
MNMRVKITPEAGYLSVVVTGEFSLPEAKRTFLHTLEVVAEHKCKKVLFDGRTIIGHPETLARFYYGEFAARSVIEYEKRGVSRVTQFAYVLIEPVLDPTRFGETVARNRGMSMKAFDNLPEALQWLEIEPSKKTGETTTSTHQD